MCAIIDTNVLASVFKQDSVNHDEFKPLYDWIKYKKGKIVYGGTKYKAEIGKYLGIFEQLRKTNKAVLVNDNDVDNETKVVSAMVQHANFDDQHLVGLLRVSGCKLICSLDERAFPYFRHSHFFAPSNLKPKIYRGKRNISLLYDSRNISKLCLPCEPLPKAERILVENILSEIK